MKRVILRILRLFIGLFLYAVGIVLTIRASLGVSPWDVFHGGLSSSVGITMGRASILVGVVLVIIDAFLGERLGWGTLANMLFIGVFMDFLMLNNLIPVFGSVILRVIMMLLGMLVIGIASFYYIGAGLGSGPRDGLMVALKKRTNRSVRFIRNSIEISVLVIGYAMGGNVGFGTLVMAIGMGYFVQFAFKIFKFDVSSVKHRFIDEDIRFIKSLIISLKTKNEQEL